MFIGSGDDIGDSPARDATYAAAQRAHINFYCLDAAGLVAPQMASKYPKPDLDPHAHGRHQLLALADNTGGRAIVNTNAPARAVPAIFDSTFRSRRFRRPSTC